MSSRRWVHITHSSAFLATSKILCYFYLTKNSYSRVRRSRLQATTYKISDQAPSLHSTRRSSVRSRMEQILLTFQASHEQKRLGHALQGMGARQQLSDFLLQVRKEDEILSLPSYLGKESLERGWSLTLGRIYMKIKRVRDLDDATSPWQYPNDFPQPILSPRPGFN